MVKLSELIAAGQLVEVQCQECRARTPLDPAFFLVRRGDIELSQLGERLYCAQCGSSDIDLSAITPSYLPRQPSKPRSVYAKGRPEGSP